MDSKQIASSLAIAATLLASTAAATAAPVAAPGYSISVFAAGPAGTSGADSVQVIGNDVYVGYSNGTPKDGSAGFSTIVEFSRSGQILASTSVAGHNDGLRYNAATNQIWATQNEDANPNLVLITPGTFAKSAPITLTSVNGGGGFDDILFQGGKTFLAPRTRLSIPIPIRRSSQPRSAAAGPRHRPCSWATQARRCSTTTRPRP
jgi:hypothetical protein